MCFTAFVSNHVSLPSHLPSSAFRVNFFFLFSYRARINTDCIRCVFLSYFQTRNVCSQYLFLPGMEIRSGSFHGLLKSWKHYGKPHSMIISKKISFWMIRRTMLCFAFGDMTKKRNVCSQYLFLPGMRIKKRNLP